MTFSASIGTQISLISPTTDSLRTALHILGVAVWLGGQIALAGIVPQLRRDAPQATAGVARAFARIAWPAMGLIVVTGVWGLAAVDASERSTNWITTLALKLVFVFVAIASTVIHSVGKSKTALAVGGAAALIGSLFAAYLGILLAHVG